MTDIQTITLPQEKSADASRVSQGTTDAPGVAKIRNSNLEILRILSMLAIIAHHYVVNSTVIELYDYSNVTPQQYFLELWGMWGKTAINSFILISGYFLCQMKLTWHRYFKLLFQIMFYGILIMLVFGICGYRPLSIKVVFKNVFGLFIYINHGFTPSFMTFYAFVPIYNVVIKSLDKNKFLWLIGGLLFVFTITSTFLRSLTMNEPFWYMTLYFVAAYVRIYPNKIFDSCRVWGWTLLISVLLAMMSVFLIIKVGTYIMTYTGNDVEKIFNIRYHFVSDSNKLLAFVVGFSAFMFAKNLKPFYNKVVNLISAGTFGVLLIHTSSNTMRKWLWQDVVNVPGMIDASMPALILHALITPLVIFAVCAFIDYFYRTYVERPIMKRLKSKKRKLDDILPDF